MNSAWSKLLIVVACTLAESEFGAEFGAELGAEFRAEDAPGAGRKANASLDTGGRSAALLRSRLGSFLGMTNSTGGLNTSVLDNLSNVCSLPCSVLGAGLRLQHLLAPCGLALGAWFASALPTLVLRSRYKVCGIRCCLWPMLMLWLSLVVSYAVYRHERVFGYAWMLHSSAHVLTTWSPPKRVLLYQWGQQVLCFVGALGIGACAWAYGGPASLIRWRSGVQSPCGWSAHLVAVLWIDLLEWLLRPLEALVLGPQPGQGLPYGGSPSAEVLHLD